MSLDRAAGILTWPIAELDPLRLSLRMQVWRVVFMIGAKLPATAIGSASSESLRSAKASALVTSRPVRGKQPRRQSRNPSGTDGSADSPLEGTGFEL